MTTPEMELAINSFYIKKQGIMVPNISWGMYINHECDLLFISKSGYATEIEIKVSKADLKKDAQKWHKHSSSWIRELYFAIPDRMNNEECINLIPEHAGIIIVKNNKASVIRKAKPKNVNPITHDQAYKLLYLTQFRYWKMRREIANLTIKKHQAKHGKQNLF